MLESLDLKQFDFYSFQCIVDKIDIKINGQVNNVIPRHMYISLSASLLARRMGFLLFYGVNDFKRLLMSSVVTKEAQLKEKELPFEGSLHSAC